VELIGVGEREGMRDGEKLRTREMEENEDINKVLMLSFYLQGDQFSILYFF